MKLSQFFLPKVSMKLGESEIALQTDKILRLDFRATTADGEPDWRPCTVTLAEGKTLSTSCKFTSSFGAIRGVSEDGILAVLDTGRIKALEIISR